MMRASRFIDSISIGGMAEMVWTVGGSCWVAVGAGLAGAGFAGVGWAADGAGGVAEGAGTGGVATIFGCGVFFVISC